MENQDFISESGYNLNWLSALSYQEDIAMILKNIKLQPPTDGKITIIKAIR